jgi:2-phospho-L-lactate guanylyltransferase
MGTVALIALKDLVQAKSRLSGLLSPSERRALAQAMAEDVLVQLLKHPRIERVILISDDPGAGMMAQTYGAELWSEASLGRCGLNNLFTSACERLVASAKTQILILHADVPLISQDDLTLAIERQLSLGGIVIGADRRGEGTNMLVMDSDSIPVFHFGERSRSKHEKAACEAGFSSSVFERSGVALDVDDPADLGVLIENLPHNVDRDGVGSKTVAMLRASGVGERVERVSIALSPAQGDSSDHLPHDAEPAQGRFSLGEKSEC